MCSALMRLVIAFNFILCIVSASNFPRGADPSKLHVYNPVVDFKCLDGSSVISFDKVNDDYCDCLDGSDEPGTAACPNGIFYCLNEGYKPTILPSSRVGDGVCDCCDGSDEYTGLIQCKNNCLALGEELRAATEKKLQLVEEGFKIYGEYVQEGTAAKTEKKAKLVELEAEKELLEADKERLEAVKKETEIPEEEAKNKHKLLWEESKSQRKAEKRKDLALKAFSEIDVNSDGRISIDEMQARSEFDIDTNGEVSHEEAKEYMEDNEEVEFPAFFEKVWDNIEQIFKSTQFHSTPSNGDEDKKESTTSTSTVEEDDERNYEDDDDDEDDNDDDDNNNIDDDIKKPSSNDADNDEPMPPYDEETQKLVAAADEARNNLNVAESKLRNIQNEIEEAKKIIDSDFGPNNEFYPLRDQCYEWSDREYIYKLCPYERATQRNKNGGSETNLGRWSKWSENGNKYLTMFYENGQNCWNGPDRSTKVLVECGLTNELTSASEPNRCEYQFTFSTPAACNKISDQVQMNTPRQEL